MGQRLDLHKVLVELVAPYNVYFQPPPTIQMEYPCVVYQRSDLDTKYADDFPYLHKRRYQVIIIDPDPDSDIPGKVADLPLCAYDRFYTADNLNHDVFQLFF